MVSSKSIDARSPLVIDTHELGRRMGAMQEIRRQVPAPDDLGTVVIGVPPQTPIDLDVRIEAVGDGVLVTGSAKTKVQGECGRCLTSITDEIEIDIQELYVHPGVESDDEASELDGELLDLEPLLRDQVVLDLPFQPVCREDCAGLCVECGANLNTDPEHAHDDAVDPRWGRLGEWAGESG